ncbi:MFS transporter [Bacillus benzoevorans]|uniref:MFS family permease n=1 Tax=Bacillus benzoevorans TaxID=1456 RepID=A0A7X0LVR7_9BACI|nr:MFS transporter [Bacillus benzoevorans]MBB6446306.1 MFS family permease [Bacillus benzoevorans]
MANINTAREHQAKGNLAFHYSNYNLFLAGSFVTRTGDWFDRVAVNWFVFTLTDSPFYIGLIEFFRLIPILVFGLVGGIAADRWERRTVLIISQIGMMVSTFILAFVIGSGTDSIIPLSIIILVRGIFLSFEIPARNAIVPELVPKQTIASAVSFYSAALNVSRIIGPAIAGFCLSVWPTFLLILINAFGFLAVIGTLFFIRPSSNPTNNTQGLNVSNGITQAFRYLKVNKLVFGVVILGVVPMIFGFPYSTLMPVFARDLLHVGSEGFGLLLTIAAVGAVVSSVVLGWGKYPMKKGLFLFISILIFGAGIFLFSFSKFFILSLIIMFFVGAASQCYRIVERVIIQEIVPDYLRGRILSIVTMDAGLLPLGSLLIGYLAGLMSPVFALAFMGMVCILTSVLAVILNREILKVP